MKLLLSDMVVQRIVRFAEEFSCEAPIFEELKIIVRLRILSIIFFRPERYSELITCHFSFSPDVGFFFEDVWSATEGDLDGQHGNIGKHVASSEVLKRNDEYVLRVLNYCERNIDLIKSVPPAWFPKAVQISDAATRKYFPDIADTDLRQKQALWESWKRARP